MIMKTITIVAAGLFATAVFAANTMARTGSAPTPGSLAPLQAQSITLGPVTGIAYYAVEADGYHLVATLAAGEDATPMRFETTLTADQKVILSVPQAAGQPALEVQFARSGEVMSVTNLSAPTN
jgi:hypothetical protein